jgi:hypothetical protein
MKTNNFSFRLLVTLIALSIFSIVVFNSCKSEDLVDNPLAKIENVKIFMSIPASNVQTGSMHAKGTTSGDSREAVQQGDTVDVQNLKDVNVILSAENDMGKGLSGTWVIYDIDTDRNANDNTFVQNTPSNSEAGSITSIKLTFLGLYKAEFRMKTGATFSFYINHTGIPGSVGDSWENNYAFRLDKETYQVVNDPGHQGYTLYIAYNEDESNRLGSSRAMIICGGNNSFTTKTGFVFYGGKEYGLQKCKYSPGYARISFLADDAPDINGMYQVYFYLGDFGYDWMRFEACNMSDWLKGETIAFQAI